LEVKKIDKHYSQWLQIWAELHGAYGESKVNTAGADVAVAATTGIYSNSGYGKMVSEVPGTANQISRIHVPLRFWFCNNAGLALPLIALQYHEVKIKMTFESAVNTDGNNTETDNSISDAKLLVDYIYLDTDERRRFAQVSHEYLIEQVQHEGKTAATAAGSSANITVNYNHPVKYIAWAVEDATTPLLFHGLEATNDNVGSNGTNEGSAKLMLNGNDRFEPREMSFFTRVQPYQHFNAVPPTDRIGVYSFANNPCDHQPSGTCNFSRIDSAIWQLKFGTQALGGTDVAATHNLYMFAVNYNVLRVMSGMGGLAYSN
jgi:hypothetical protein